MNVILAISFAVASLFHTVLKASSPARNATVAAPTSVSLTFTEKVNPALSSISILKRDSTEVEKLVVKATSEPARIEGAVKTRLAPAAYLIRWKTVSADGHVVRGTFGFTVKPTT
ncbi:MAG: copper resistance CopC family protein [Gemmatimonadales bacterium]